MTAPRAARLGLVAAALAAPALVAAARPARASSGEQTASLSWVRLAGAEACVGARPAEALALADAHLARFPGGALAQEREVIAVGALKALGRGGEALARANRFVAAHPSSAYRRRLEILVPELRGAPR
ncbi:hypothetical protein WMF45_36245 [Sorangium sp. So ce448]|uniref:hypothetical protein n=1 Tax=Sorangium sp. So ce448 TaxID=3133314 RepID=UPI003F5E5459